MSVWSWTELEDCRRFVFPSLPSTDVRSRYGRWGGLPRYVLEKIGKVDQLRLDEAINRSSIPLVEQAELGIFSNPEVTDLLLHRVVEDDFVTTRLEWASFWVVDRFIQKELSLNGTADRLLRFIFGQRYDRYILRAGGERS
jgi:hypothetical protein